MASLPKLQKYVDKIREQIATELHAEYTRVVDIQSALSVVVDTRFSKDPTAARNAPDAKELHFVSVELGKLLYTLGAVLGINQ